SESVPLKNSTEPAAPVPVTVAVRFTLSPCLAVRGCTASVVVVTTGPAGGGALVGKVVPSCEKGRDVDISGSRMPRGRSASEHSTTISWVLPLAKPASCLICSIVPWNWPLNGAFTPEFTTCATRSGAVSSLITTTFADAMKGDWQPKSVDQVGLRFASPL